MRDTDREIITLERYLKASPAKVFDAWVQPDTRARWFAPDAAIYAADGGTLCPGMRETIMLRIGQTLEIHDLTYLEITPARCIHYRDECRVGGLVAQVSEVTATFKSARGGTILSIREKLVSKSPRHASLANDLPDAQPFVARRERLVAGVH